MRGVLFALMALASTARADVERAREDIVDMRHGRLPARGAALGWTSDGAFVYRHTACVVQDASDIPSCRVSVDVVRPRGTDSHLLFAAEWDVECVEQPQRANPACWSIATTAASQFLAAERALMTRLGPLRPGTPGSADLASGTLVAVRYDDARGDRRRAAIAVSRSGRWRPVRVIWSVEGGKDEFLRRDPRITHVERSPDGAWLAVVSSLAHAETDVYWDSVRVDVIASP